MKYTVKNPFYLRGELIQAGEIVVIDDDLYEQLKPKNVLGDEVRDNPEPVKPSKRKKAGDTNAEAETGDETGD